jgi:putative DNA methylase
LEAHASDLNPVAVMINKAMIEIPPKFAGRPPVNPDARSRIASEDEWQGARGLAEDVRYYGEWMKKEAFKSIGHLYPKVKDEHGHEHTVIAWIWARTVKCPNPACGCEMPLASSFVLSKKKDKEVYVQPIIEGKNIRYEVKYGIHAPNPPKYERASFKCLCCGEIASNDYVRKEAVEGHMGAQLMAIVAEGQNRRLYFSPTLKQEQVALHAEPSWKPDQLVTTPCHDVDRLPMYGMPTWGDAFTKRQLVALTTFCDLIPAVQTQVQIDGASKEYAQMVSVYLAFIIDQVANHSSKICGWNNINTQRSLTFSRQALRMMWDYAECNIFSNSTGSYNNLIERQIKGLLHLGFGKTGSVKQADAQTDNGMRNILVSTDPPYYDNISYADLSDFFYVWLRQSLKSTFPGLFRTLLVPKTEELVATPYRFEGSKDKAFRFFEDGMAKAFRQINSYVSDDAPTTVYYAYKQSEIDYNSNVASTGWETMLSAIIQSGFTLVGTWPINTERPTGLKAFENALASSIVLVCRKRPADAPVCTRRDFINTLKRELKPALQKLQTSNIAPVDLAQSAIGPGMGVYSRFSEVLEADGKPMSVRSALQIINQELDLYFTEQDGELDRDSRFCVDLYTQYAFNDMKFGEADVLARAKNTSVEKLAARGALYAQKGVVRLLSREEITGKIEHGDVIIWLLTQQLTRALEKDGVTGAAKIITDIFTSEPEHAKALAYRLFQIAERKGWAQEAYTYNSLVIAWPDVQNKAVEIMSRESRGKQRDLFDEEG